MGNNQYLEVESIAGTDWHHYAYSWALKSLHLPSSPFDEETYKITSKVLEYIATLFCKGRGYIEPGKEICNVRSTFNNVLAIDAINKNFDASHYIFLNKLLNQKKNLSEPVKQNALVKVEQICSRFHLVVKQLMSYHSDKNSIIINDEYDTQNLLHSLLHIYFDDIRREEYTPSYVGGSARVDFLLKNESIFIEVKKTRKNLKAKQIRDELLVDIQQYQTHPDCKKLVCFIYDPERLIPNPLGIEKDLKHESKDFVVKVIIVPKEY
ncbi:hypothetical protein HZA55_04935 [Candidatus Poribacteria bacterium]|nr:hypothetical protein [Candidatus Poribacteria bacterium]